MACRINSWCRYRCWRMRESRSESQHRTRAGTNRRRRNTRTNRNNHTEQTGNTMLDSMSQTHAAHTPVQNSTRSLPLYNEQAPDGEVVLLERIHSASDGPEGHGGNEIANPFTAVVPPYADSSSAARAPPVTATTTSSPRGSMDVTESVRDLSGDPVSYATTTTHSTNAAEPENVHVGVSTSTDTPEGTVTATDPPRGEFTYEEDVTTRLVLEVTETLTPPTRPEQG
ncbi:unnamed protein product [Rhizoctonia solani]|uniref:Uncharacterized protein n=1 Tax=Rhizoctonia solani TaxID=456999 RepID=A0A8H3HYJ3_9AGAM|nr:unnamed protein product [Rhizoctonia solani]